MDAGAGLGLTSGRRTTGGSAMTELQTRCLDTFPEWLRTLATDASELSQVLASTTASDTTRRFVAGGLNYLFKSLDLIPDGIEDLGFLDDAFVFRVSAALAVADGATEVAELASEAELLKEFLGGDYDRLERFVVALSSGSARGRTVDDIISDAAVCSSFVNDVKGWAQSYVVPSFGRDVKNLVKLRSFLGTKLPA